MGDLFAERSGLAVEWVDESFTTTEAQDTLIAPARARPAQGRDRCRRRGRHTARWLDRRRDAVGA